MQAKERFSGPFEGRTKNPILILGSPYDPVTPLIDAKNVSRSFQGSVLLQHNAVGHTSIAQPSRCVIDATRASWINGTLPEAGTVCEPDFAVFSNHTLMESYLQAAQGELIDRKLI